MPYKPPLCKCKSPLRISANITMTVGIRKDGKPKMARSPVLKDNTRFMVCWECGRHFHVEYDEKGRVKRGEELNYRK